jgi:hypothetical protein
MGLSPGRDQGGQAGQAGSRWVPARRVGDRGGGCVVSAPCGAADDMGDGGVGEATSAARGLHKTPGRESVVPCTKDVDDARERPVH